jgi:hypothetical protein
MKRIRDPEPGEWQEEVNAYGGVKRFRMIGQIKEYEPTITINGLEIPQSQLEDYHRRQKEAAERRKAEALEAAKNRPEPRSCPFSNGCNNTCTREGCNIFLKGKCSIATIADASGVEIEEAPAQNSKCPFSIYGRCQGCALYNKGCAIVRIAAATYKE